MYKLIVFIPDNELDLIKYVDNILITSLIDYEIVNESNPIVSRYIPEPYKYPYFILFKNNIKKSDLKGKPTRENLLKWLDICWS